LGKDDREGIRGGNGGIGRLLKKKRKPYRPPMRLRNHGRKESIPPNSPIETKITTAQGVKSKSLIRSPEVRPTWDNVQPKESLKGIKRGLFKKGSGGGGFPETQGGKKIVHLPSEKNVGNNHAQTLCQTPEDTSQPPHPAPVLVEEGAVVEGEKTFKVPRQNQSTQLLQPHKRKPQKRPKIKKPKITPAKEKDNFVGPDPKKKNHPDQNASP